MKDPFRYPGKSSSDVLSLFLVPREYVWKAGRVVPVVVFRCGGLAPYHVVTLGDVAASAGRY